ncbi:MAG: c-type cytochrome, partial [Acidobacteriota bacterium]
MKKFHKKNPRVGFSGKWGIPAAATFFVMCLVASSHGCTGREKAIPEGGSEVVTVSTFPVEPYPAVLEPDRLLPSSNDLLALGKRVYEKNCLACHGRNGEGDGEAAYLLYPKPRVFTDGKFAIVSTWDRVPTDRDLFRTISRGMPGSAMPSWNHLPEAERWGLVHYVKSFSKFPLTVSEARDPVEMGDIGGGIVRVPPEPAYGDKERDRAAFLYREACASCHGSTGRGDGVDRQVDDWGFETRPRDLTRGIYKGEPRPGEIYRRIIAGLPGTPMPMSNWSYGEEAWHLVHYILEMSSESQRRAVEMRRFPIPAVRVPSVPPHPDSGLWRQAPAVVLHLMPLWWRNDRPESLTVRALHDGERIGIFLQWADRTHDHTVMRPQDFRDAAAVQL